MCEIRVLNTLPMLRGVLSQTDNKLNPKDSYDGRVHRVYEGQLEKFATFKMYIFIYSQSDSLSEESTEGLKSRVVWYLSRTV